MEQNVTRILAALFLVCPSLSAHSNTFHEAFGIDLFKESENNIRLGMYSNEKGSESSLAVDFKFGKIWSLDKKYPNENKTRFSSSPSIPRITPTELISMGQNDYSSFSQQRIDQLFSQIDYSLDDFTTYNIKFDAEGLLSLNDAANLKNFTKFRTEGSYSEWIMNQYTYGIGGFASYETDQKNDNAQYAYGLTAFGQYWFKKGVANEYVFLKLEYGEVDPSENVQRVELLDGDKSAFYRWEADLTVQFDLSVEQIDKVELSYRYFYEPSAPDEIGSIGLDDFALFTVGIFFEKGWYIAFSEGELPFSVKEDQVFELGWSYSFD
jgi:hypothetical protein